MAGTPVSSSNSTKGLDAQITPFAGSDEDWGKPSDSCGVMKPSTTLFEGAQATAQFRSLVRRAQTGRHLIIAPKAEKLVMIAQLGVRSCVVTRTPPKLLLLGLLALVAYRSC